MPGLKPQQILDGVFDYFFVQKKPASIRKVKSTERSSANAGYICAYRAGQRACGVGCLIPETLYDPKMDDPNALDGDTSVRELFRFFPEVRRLFGGYRNVGLLEVIQNAHDESALELPLGETELRPSTAARFRETFYPRLANIAAVYELHLPAWPQKATSSRETA